ncbi:MAG TPA: adenylate/guanylate cyclase domain-containing protein [Gaiellaceae bacterium]|nr:adenylate/guanylate cyclase domain-containing protein [Gaiellaceae bacterium]
MTRPETRYAKASEGGYVAYQLFGSGSVDLVFVTNWITNCDAMWEEPTMAAYFERLARFARVLCFDKRGTGVSDPVPLSDLPRLEEWMDDVQTVMDAAQIERAALLGDTEGGPMAMMFAATHPDRVSALALVNSFARWRRADDYPIGMPHETAEKLVDRYEQHYGVTSEILALTAPTSAHDARFARWFTRYQRLGMPRGAATTMYRWVTELDVRSILPSIRVPTLVLQRRDALHHRAAFGRYLAEQIPGARYVELPGADTLPVSAGDFGLLLGEVEEFLTGARAVPVLNRQLATVMITDIVDSTHLAAERGDAAWVQLVQQHDDVVREQLDTYRGREIDHTGDGFLATFDGPARAVTCAARLEEALRARGITIRAGIHTGEVELVGGALRGLAIHIAARVMSTAERGGILVSGTVRDLVVGSGIEFAERGTYELKGVPGSWVLSEVISAP